MRQWRVGTVSMGLSLLIMGLFLLASQVFETLVFDTLIAWWPLIFITLGLEILLYAFVSKKEHSLIKYDFLSILFIGVLGSIAIGFSLLTSTGAMAEIRYAINHVEVTRDLPEVHHALGPEVQKVIVETSSHPVKIEGIGKKELRAIGTYQTVSAGDHIPEIASGKDYISIATVGDTAYLTLKELPQKNGLNANHPSMEVTLFVPQQVQVEIEGKDNPIQLNPGRLSSNWLVENGAEVAVKLASNSDIALSAFTEQEPLQGNVSWSKKAKPQKAKPQSSQTEEAGYYQSSLQIGKGQYHLDILKSRQVRADAIKAF